MNFFFGFQNEIISSEITVPKYDYSGERIYSDYKIYSAEPENEYWKVNLAKVEENKNFFLIKNSEINNKKIFFLSKESQIKDKLLKNEKLKNLYNFNTFSDNKIVEFRANLKIYLENRGFSSYQSEYPYEMTIKNGSVLSPLSVLLSNKNDYNFIFYRNIFYKPIKHKFDIFFINIENKEILFKQTLFTNSSNQILVDKKFIKKNVYFFAKGYLGIPIFLSIKNNHLSFEHTHPPHLYILSDNKFKIISKLKEKIDEIVN